MKRSIASLLLAGGLTISSLPARAADPMPCPENPQVALTQKQRLDARSKELLQRLRRPTSVRASRGPGAGQVARRNEIRRQRREIEALIQRLEAGERVAPGEVERLLDAR